MDLLIKMAESIMTLLRGLWRTSPDSRPAVMFWKEMLRSPTSVGAFCPSSRALATSMARLAPTGGNGLIIELGAGTGSVTAALIESGIDPERLMIVENSPVFVQHLLNKYPGIRIVQGDACHLDQIIPDGLSVDAIISSLPLRSLDLSKVKLIIDQWFRALPSNGCVIQFTYSLRGIRKHYLEGFSVQTSAIVWNNIPPARIMTFTSTSAR